MDNSTTSHNIGNVWRLYNTIRPRPLQRLEKLFYLQSLIMQKIINIIVTIIVSIAIASMFVWKTNASSEWTKQTHEKQEKLKRLGFSDTLSHYIIKRCKQTAKNPSNCVIIAGFIGKNESNAGRNAYNHNVWGINEGKTYKTDEENFDRWMKSYNKWWFSQKFPSHFYSERGKLPRTMYCTSEESSNSKVGCPFGLRNAKIAYNLLTQ